MKRNGFTMVELLAVIAILGILTGVAVASFDSFTNKAKQSTYTEYEKTMKSAATNYLMANASSIPAEGREVAITAETLIKNGYLESMIDPSKRDTRCDTLSYMVVRQDASPNGFNMNLVYTPCLICEKYKSSTCPVERPSNVK